MFALPGLLVCPLYSKWPETGKSQSGPGLELGTAVGEGVGVGASPHLFAITHHPSLMKKAAAGTQ